MVKKFFKTRQKQLKEDEHIKNVYTLVHRYFRLHQELLEDSIYKSIYDCIRNELIIKVERDMKKKNLNHSVTGIVIDAVADSFNEENQEFINEQKRYVDLLYKVWTEEETK